MIILKKDRIIRIYKSVKSDFLLCVARHLRLLGSTHWILWRWLLERLIGYCLVRHGAIRVVLDHLRLTARTISNRSLDLVPIDRLLRLHVSHLNVLLICLSLKLPLPSLTFASSATTNNDTE
jgi:hypothetical protein